MNYETALSFYALDLKQQQMFLVFITVMPCTYYCVVNTVVHARKKHLQLQAQLLIHIINTKGNTCVTIYVTVAAMNMQLFVYVACRVSHIINNKCKTFYTLNGTLYVNMVSSLKIQRSSTNSSTFINELIQSR